MCPSFFCLLVKYSHWKILSRVQSQVSFVTSCPIKGRRVSGLTFAVVGTKEQHDFNSQRSSESSCWGKAVLMKLVFAPLKLIYDITRYVFRQGRPYTVVSSFLTLSFWSKLKQSSALLSNVDSSDRQQSLCFKGQFSALWLGLRFLLIPHCTPRCSMDFLCYTVPAYIWTPISVSSSCPWGPEPMVLICTYAPVSHLVLVFCKGWCYCRYRRDCRAHWGTVWGRVIAPPNCVSVGPTILF